MTYRGVLFDLDGTLLNTVELIVRSYQHTFRQCLGLEVERSRILCHLGLTLPGHLALYASEPKAVAEMVSVYRTFNLAHHDELAALFPGVDETVAELAAAGVSLGVVSSKTRNAVGRGLDLFGLRRYFGAVICLEDTVHHKPDPAPVALALRQLRLDAAEAVMVGDSPADLEAGQRAGTATAAVAWSTAAADELAACRPDHLLQRPAELIGLCRAG